MAEAEYQTAATICEALNGAPVAIAIVAADGHIMAANGALRRAIDAAGTALGAIQLGSGPDVELDEAFSSALRGNSECFETSQLACLGDIQGSWRVHVQPFRHGGRIVGALLLLEDLSEQVLAASAFEASEHRFRALVDNAGIGIAVHRAGVLLYVNAEAARILRHEHPDELVGRLLLDLVHPDDRENAHRRIAEAERLGRAAPSRERYLGADGRVVTVETTLSRAPVEQYPSGLVIFRPVESWAVDADAAGTSQELNGFDLPGIRLDLADLEACWAAVDWTSNERTSGLVRRGQEVLARLRAKLVPTPDDQGATHGAVPSPQPSPERATVPHVLICDDEHRLASLMGGLLEQSGYRATTVTTGVAALASLGNNSFDAVLLDVNLPGENTADILSRFRALAPRLPVLLSSGYPVEDLPADIAHAPNVVGYLDKPYTVDRLVTVLDAVLARAKEWGSASSG